MWVKKKTTTCFVVCQMKIISLAYFKKSNSTFSSTSHRNVCSTNIVRNRLVQIITLCMNNSNNRACLSKSLFVPLKWVMKAYDALISAML